MEPKVCCDRFFCVQIHLLACRKHCFVADDFNPSHFSFSLVSIKANYFSLDVSMVNQSLNYNSLFRELKNSSFNKQANIRPYIN
jgi:hypothetical protein